MRKIKGYQLRMVYKQKTYICMKNGRIIDALYVLAKNAYHDEKEITYTKIIRNAGKKIAISALRTIYRKSADNLINELLIGIYSNGVSGNIDGEDLIQIAIESLNVSIVTNQADGIKNSYKSIYNHVYKSRKNHQQLKHAFVRDYDESGDESAVMLSLQDTKIGIDTIEDSMALQQIIESLPLNASEKRIIRLLVNGDNLTKIAMRLNVSKQAISKKLAKIRKTIPIDTLKKLMTA